MRDIDAYELQILAQLKSENHLTKEEFEKAKELYFKNLRK